MIKYIQKQDWLPIFTRADFPYFIVDLALNGFVIDMKNKIHWGYREQLVISNKNILTVYYSKRDSLSFKKYIKNINTKIIYKSINIIETQLEKSEKQIIDAERMYKDKSDKKDLIDIVNKIYWSFRNLYAVYRFPTLIDSVGGLIIDGSLVKYMSKIKDQCAHFNKKHIAGILSNISAEISKEIGIDKKYVLYLNKNEIIKSINIGSSVVSTSEIKKRYNGYICLAYNEKTILNVESISKKLVMYINRNQKNVNENIRGSTAFPGMLKGKVKIIKSVSELKKNKNIAILVSPMTTVDFMPYIKKIKAIITDEGGLTCHAALLSREFKIPCIVGTKVATKVLKDGDEVEVDANKGIVKKI